ncbi:cAMP-activated global transcriptional regulator CRP [Halieaceae bacterium IMCC14734]|uniref:cAMP-activated global transcriptional regulator CRP n=1 Tax=Candidatus Litorirhabdus singularis TaxID=2518993 RepID=A0ABT3TFL9_9GAMM|nr:cAMP-activated global transcriptional regulator CRP [Candidatus Litorirhabdus singularis]MCX2980207.1 cAMP-activated global transcriptional regulator CRP [Candidatus Litorirhabdus singularis]
MINARVRNLLPNIESFLDHCQRRTFKSRTTLVSAGEPSESFFFVLEGSLSVVIKSEEGQDMVVTYVNPGDFFGEVGLYKRVDKVREASIQAKTNCEVAEISYERFYEVKEQFPEILYAIGAQMADRLTNATKKLHDLAFVDAKGRITNALYDLCKEPDAMTHPDGMQIKVSRQELGRIVGCSREVAGRILKVLEQEGMVQVAGHTMVVLGTR